MISETFLSLNVAQLLSCLFKSLVYLTLNSIDWAKFIHLQWKVIEYSDIFFVIINLLFCLCNTTNSIWISRNHA